MKKGGVHVEKRGVAEKIKKMPAGPKYYPLRLLFIDAGRSSVGIKIPVMGVIIQVSSMLTTFKTQF